MLMVLCKELKISPLARVCWFACLFFPPFFLSTKEHVTQINTISLQPARQDLARHPYTVSGGPDLPVPGSQPGSCVHFPGTTDTKSKSEPWASPLPRGDAD